MEYTYLTKKLPVKNNNKKKTKKNKKNKKNWPHS